MYGRNCHDNYCLYNKATKCQKPNRKMFMMCEKPSRKELDTLIKRANREGGVSANN